MIDEGMMDGRPSHDRGAQPGSAEEATTDQSITQMEQDLRRSPEDDQVAGALEALGAGIEFVEYR